tara:strand:+ start:141 stop:1904 length:1764 start_codon:yes stop_codon:yes gene_type:complete
MPVFENVKLNTQQDPAIIAGFFRNPFGQGPDSSEVRVTLPVDTVPVFTICGDSTSIGQTSTKYWIAEELQPYVDRQGSDWPYQANDGSAFGYFWNKFLDTSGGDGVNFTKDEGLLKDITTSGDAFIPIHPRMGGKQLSGSFTYRIADGSPVDDYLSIASGSLTPDPLAHTDASGALVAYNGQPGSISPVWDFARTLKGLFVDPSGNEIAPYFIFLGATGPRFGTPGNPFGGSTLDWYNKRGLPLNTVPDASAPGPRFLATDTGDTFVEYFHYGGNDLEMMLTLKETAGAPGMYQAIKDLDLSAGDTLTVSGRFGGNADSGAGTLAGTSYDFTFTYPLLDNTLVFSDVDKLVSFGNANGGTYQALTWTKGPKELTDPTSPDDAYFEAYGDDSGGLISMTWTLQKNSGPEEDIDLGYVHNQFRQTYIRPAVNNIVNVLGKNPVHVGNIIMTGGADGNTIYPDEYQTSAGLAYLNYTNSIQSILNLSGDVSAATLPPTVMYLPYNAIPPGTDAFPADKTKLLQKSVKRVWADGIRNFVSLDSLFMDKVDGIHFRPISYALYGELFARAYTNMLTVRNYEILAPTMAQILY